MVVAANTIYETGKCAIDAYFAYENSGGKLNGDVVKGVAGAVVMGGLTAFGIHVAANKVDNLSRAISDPTGCFVAGTQVPTVDGYKNIEDIEVGDQVYSENPYTGEKGYKKVVEIYVKEKHTIVYLKVNNETIETTNEHPFWVEEENAFVKAEDLEVGDTLRLRDGETVTLEGIESKTSEDITKVYNFQVADWHTYYVTDMDILVHNNCVGLADSVGGSDLYHSANAEYVDVMKRDGFKINYPTSVKAFSNNRFGMGVYLGDSPAIVLAERPGGIILKVQADLGKNLNVVNRGVIGEEDYELTHAIARGARKHGYNSITFLSKAARDQGFTGINTVIFEPKNVVISEVIQ
mgnify:CR=1 FL=1